MPNNNAQVAQELKTKIAKVTKDIRRQLDQYAQKTKQDLKKQQKMIETRVKTFGNGIKEIGQSEVNKVVTHLKNQELFHNPVVKELLTQVEKLNSLSKVKSEFRRNLTKAKTRIRSVGQQERTRLVAIQKNVQSIAKKLGDPKKADKLVSEVANKVIDSAKQIQKGILKESAKKVKRLSQKMDEKAKMIKLQEEKTATPAKLARRSTRSTRVKATRKKSY